MKLFSGWRRFAFGVLLIFLLTHLFSGRQSLSLFPVSTNHSVSCIIELYKWTWLYSHQSESWTAQKCWNPVKNLTRNLIIWYLVLLLVKACQIVCNAKVRFVFI